MNITALAAKVAQLSTGEREACLAIADALATVAPRAKKRGRKKGSRGPGRPPKASSPSVKKAAPRKRAIKPLTPEDLGG